VTCLDPLLSLVAAKGGRISRQQLGSAFEELRSDGEAANTYAVTNAIQALLFLGHLDEIERGKLTLTPSIWARLPPKNGSRAVLCGYRPPLVNGFTAAKLQMEGAKFKYCDSTFSIEVVTLDTALPSELEAAARATGIPLTASPSAWELAVVGEDIKNLRTSLESKWSSSVRPPDFAQYFDPQSLRFCPKDEEDCDTLRLWRWMGERSQWQFAITLKQSQFAFLPPSSVLVAKHAVISAQNTSCLKYNPSTQEFACPIKALPPTYLARALTLCNGMLRDSVLFGGIHWIVWRNVPTAIARQVSEKLGQGLCPLVEINRR
jgi:hypothetical protein